MKDHIEQYQFPKFGLRYFFPADGNRDISLRPEFGPKTATPVPSYQLDRGRFENELLRRNIVAMVHAFDGCRVEEVELGSDDHKVTISRDDDTATVAARWVVDATGRRSLLKKQLGLGKEVEHKINSSWFRLGGGIDLEEWSDDPDWLGRIVERGKRRMSTNHLMGEGYWVWLIPLASGAISIGIVADPRIHPFESMNTLDGALAWLEEHEPPLHATVSGRLDQIEDFLKVEHFSFGCERVFSQERWCLTGEAGVFADPLYSPGSDFIATANGFITDLITRDLDGEPIGERLEAFNAQYLQLFDAFLQLYTNQYPHFGNPQVMTAKLMWDHAVYWAVSALRYLNGKLTDLELMQAIGPVFGGAIGLTIRLEALFRDWHELEPPAPQPSFLPIDEVPGVGDRWRELAETFDDEQLRARFFANLEFLEALTVMIFHRAARALPGEPIDENTAIKPMAVSLKPERWEEEGLIDPAGLSLVAARERAPGLDEYLSAEAVKTS